MTDPTPSSLTLYPAIDLRGGRCVRLEQGRTDRQTTYDADPISVARDFAAQGAEWVHVVDLDAAFGEGSNRQLIIRIAEEVPELRVQTGGGLRSEADLGEVLGSGVARAVIGTAAIQNPDLAGVAVGRWGAERIAVGLDARGRTPALRGWVEDSSEDLLDVAERLHAAGVTTFIYTDISRDGMFLGPNLEVSAELGERTGAEVIVSGGVGSLEHLDNVRRAAAPGNGIAGVIVGKAIYEGRITVETALHTLRG